MIALHGILRGKPFEIEGKVLEFGVIGIAAPCAYCNPVERAFGEHRRGVVDDDDLRQIFGDLPQRLFVRFAVGA